MSMRGARSTTTQETLQKVEKIVRDAVEERFGSYFGFDPIVNRGPIRTRMNTCILRIVQGRPQ